MITNSMEQSPSWEADSFSASQKNPPRFMDSNSSLPHSQEPATYPYVEADQSSPCPIQLLLDQF